MSKHTEELLEFLASALQVPPECHKAAIEHYKSVGEWLHRDKSEVRGATPEVYIQGSFRLGTAIRPISENEDYDVDIVCELTCSKDYLTQANLKALLGKELKAYTERNDMRIPEESRRCWTQNYSGEAQFHMDVLPALSDTAHKYMLLEKKRVSPEWIDTAIAITDREHENFNRISEDWPHSNPKGYANWFRSRMKEIFEARRSAIAINIRESVENIPEYEVQTPLQSAIQILKYHRDMMFKKQPDDKPISIIITTLAAHAYQQELTISEALSSILNNMDKYIELRNDIAWVTNPTDPEENFADRWQKYPEREVAFRNWLKQARFDFDIASHLSNYNKIEEVLRERFGNVLFEKAIANRKGSIRSRFTKNVRNIGARLNPSHRKSPQWTELQQGEVKIEEAIALRDGFRPQRFNDSEPLDKHCNLTFQADTNIQKPYRVYWQIVNTGHEAEVANCLRGGFNEGTVNEGKLTRKECTLYKGIHSIECFIVKNDYLVAQSGQFIVNIK